MIFFADNPPPCPSPNHTYALDARPRRSPTAIRIIHLAAAVCCAHATVASAWANRGCSRASGIGNCTCGRRLTRGCPRDRWGKRRSGARVKRTAARCFRRFVVAVVAAVVVEDLLTLLALAFVHIRSLMLLHMPLRLMSHGPATVWRGGLVVVVVAVAVAVAMMASSVIVHATADGHTGGQYQAAVVAVAVAEIWLGHARRSRCGLLWWLRFSSETLLLEAVGVAAVLLLLLLLQGHCTATGRYVQAAITAAASRTRTRTRTITATRKTPCRSSHGRRSRFAVIVWPVYTKPGG